MLSLVKNTLKNAALGFAVGVAASLVLPLIATGIGIPGAVGHLANPLWLGSFVAVLNAGTSLIQPALDFVFGKQETPPEQKTEREIHLNLALQLAPKSPGLQPAQETAAAPSTACTTRSLAQAAAQPAVFFRQ